MLLTFAILILITTSLLLVSLLHLKSKIAYLLAVYLISFAQIVLVEEIASTFYSMNNQFFILALHLVLLSLLYFYWKHHGKPTILGPFRSNPQENPKLFSRQFNLQHPEIFTLALFVGISFLLEIFLIYFVPPNTHDSMATHMARVGYWLQNGSFFPWDVFNTRQIFYPINAGLQVSWLVLFSGSEKVVGLVQWFGMLSAMLAIYGATRLFTFSKRKALLVCLLFATFPIVIMQSTTSQLDLIVSGLFGIMMYFLLLGLKQENTTALSLSGLGLGLTLGTKQTILFMLPGLGLFWLLILIKKKWIAINGLKTWLASTLIAFVVFGMYINVINYFEFGTPLGTKSSLHSETADMTPATIGERLLYNGSRLLYCAADPTGLPKPIKGYSIKSKAYTLQPLFDAFDIDLESDMYVSTGHSFDYLSVPNTTEDEAWFGWLGFLLLISGIIYNFIIGLKQRDPYRLGIILICVLYFALIVLLRPGWDPFQGRYFIPLVVVCAPFMAVPEEKKTLAHLLRWAVVLVAILILITTHLTNSGKPLVGFETIWNASRTEKITMQNRYYRKILEMVDDFVPEDATLGLISSTNSWEYPLFGEKFEHRLIAIKPHEKITDENWLHEQGIEYLLIDTVQDIPAPFSQELLKIGEVHGWQLYTWK